MIPPNISQFNLSLFHLPSLYHCSCKNVFYETVGNAVAGVIILVIKIISNVFVLWCFLLDCNLKQGNLRTSYEWQALGYSPLHYTGRMWYLYRERRSVKSSMDCTSKWWTTSSYKTCRRNTAVRQLWICFIKLYSQQNWIQSCIGCHTSLSSWHLYEQTSIENHSLPNSLENLWNVFNFIVICESWWNLGSSLRHLAWYLQQMLLEYMDSVWHILCECTWISTFPKGWTQKKFCVQHQKHK